MKRIFVVGLLLGSFLIAVLGGFLAFHIHKIKGRIETALNQGLTNYDVILHKEGMKLTFDPVACDGFVFIRCRNQEVKLFADQKGKDPLLSFTNLELAVQDFDTQSITVQFASNFDFLQKGDLEGYFNVLMPKEIKIAMKFALETMDSFLLHTTFDLDAQNVTYHASLDNKIISKRLEDNGLVGYMENPTFQDRALYLLGARLHLTGKDLSDQLYKVVRQQYGNLDKSNYQGLVALMSTLSKTQFQYSKDLQVLIDGIAQLALGKKEEMDVKFNAKDPICFTCPSMPKTEEIVKGLDIVVGMR
ncbi:hypothetical protein [Helicobacter pametensis]|uniref:hypothetical protein n=1 Tax=Helicobacter pametensis TaxID=95149 RepID=UPI000486CA39|nr:hypothetical protein [Helicobacter pametensis]